MTGPERRQTPRTTMDRHAYINIEPNNGGIVLNVSEGGLCFHSFDPVPRNGKVRFWFSDHNQRIEADGTLAWTDETQKGGLRFATLPAAAQERIRDWISHPTTGLAGDEVSAPAGPQPRAFTYPSARAETKSASVPLAVVLPELKIPVPLSPFSRGLATGLLVSVVVVAALLFHNYRREFGESLIELGERFAAKPQTQSATVSAASQMVSPESAPLSSAPRMKSPTTQAGSAAPPVVSQPPALIADARPEKVVPPPEKPAPQPLAAPAKPQPAKPEAPTAVDKTSPKASATIAAAANPSTPPPTSLPITAPIAAPVAPPITAPASASTAGPTAAGKPGPAPEPVKAPKLELVNQPGVHTEGSEAENADSTRELYFEVGKFKNPLQAQDESSKLAQLGFPVTAVQKGFLWTNSVHVLVGPYPDEDQAKVTHENLVSDGFKPRPFEKGWRNFTLLSSMTLNGARTPEGEYIVSWESYIGDASVKFLHNDSVVASAGGKWVKHERKYPRDAYVYRRNADGSRTLLEIHFGGMRQALVFGKPS